MLADIVVAVMPFADVVDPLVDSGVVVMGEVGQAPLVYLGGW
jgi:hypothetical protein|tara:strand:+ start:545 stop:670 length:126 start_codon:yes stop_codon:yes gene_type:complete